jgi:hypothetical protein
MAFPRDKNFVTTQAWIKKLHKGLFVIEADIKIGQLSVIDASVESSITTPNGQIIKLKLFDITKFDGIGLYKKLFPTNFGPGLYKIEVFANDNGLTSYTQTTANASKQIGTNNTKIFISYLL